jgi:hypothetical protein
MEEVINWRKQIKNRLEEKKKSANARKGALWLFMVVSGLVMLTLLRVSFLFANKPITVPPEFISVVAVLASALFVLWKGRRYIKDSALNSAVKMVQIALMIIAFSLILLIIGTSQWLVELKSFHGFSAGGQLVFLIFYSGNMVVGIFNLFSVYKKLKACEIHSMNMENFNKSFLFWAFLLISFTVFVLGVAL